jgi:hypothetical protein
MYPFLLVVLWGEVPMMLGAPSPLFLEMPLLQTQGTFPSSQEHLSKGRLERSLSHQVIPVKPVPSQSKVVIRRVESLELLPSRVVIRRPTRQVA